MLENQFYTRFVLNVIIGLMFVYAMIKMARHNNQETQPTKHTVMDTFGGLFTIFSLFSLVSCLIKMTSIDFPSSINQPLLGTHPIAHPSSSTLYWGMPTPIQHSVLSTILCTFGAVGLSGYLFFYRKSNSPWWKKILKFFAGFFLFALMFSATNFHYFTADEFIAIILFLLLWILIVRRKDSVKKQKTDSEVSDTKNIPIINHENTPQNVSDNKNLSNTISQSLNFISKSNISPTHESQIPDQAPTIFHTNPIEKDERLRLYTLSHKTKSNAIEFKNYLIENGITYLYHFTDQRNLASIKLHGGLFSWKYCDEHNIRIPLPGGDRVSRDLDSRYGLQDYVRLSFCNDHPMAWNLKENGANLILLKIKVDVAWLEETLFSDLNATDKAHHHGATMADLQRVDLNATQQHFVSKENPIFKKHQAEVLVKTHIPLEYIININNPDRLSDGERALSLSSILNLAKHNA